MPIDFSRGSSLTSLARRLDCSNGSNSLDLGLVSRHSHGSSTAPYPRPAAGRHTDGHGNASVLPGGGDQALSGVRLPAEPRRGGLVPLRGLRGAEDSQEEAGSTPAGSAPTAHERNRPEYCAVQRIKDWIVSRGLAVSRACTKRERPAALIARRCFPAFDRTMGAGGRCLGNRSPERSRGCSAECTRARRISRGFRCGEAASPRRCTLGCQSRFFTCRAGTGRVAQRARTSCRRILGYSTRRRAHCACKRRRRRRTRASLSTPTRRQQTYFGTQR